MAKLILITFVVASVCFIGTFCDLSADAKSFWHVKKNAIYQYRFAKVEIEQIIYQKVHVTKSKAKDDEQKACIDKVKVECIAESDDILENTVGKILPTIEDVSAALTNGDQSKLNDFNNKWNYEQFKKDALNDFKSKSATLAADVQSKLDKCVA